MDNKNLSFTTLAKLESALDLDRLAALSGFARRACRKLTPGVWLRSLVVTGLAGKATFAGNALSAGLLSGVAVSRQALHSRMGGPAVRFLSAVLGEALASRLGGPPPSLGKFRRVLVEDSASVSLPKALAPVFPGSVNRSAGSATLKVHGVFELLARRLEAFRIEPYLVPDQSGASEIASLAGEGDLVVRDLGYFSIPALQSIARAKARFLSRLNTQCALRDLDGRRLDLLAELRSLGGLDREILLGNARMPARVVATRVPGHVAQSRRRKLRRSGRKENSALFALQDWTIHITNASAAELPASQMQEVYRQRWAVEILFKSWKSGFNLSGIHARASAATAQCLVLANLILSCMAHHLVLPLLEKGAAARASPCKLASMLSIALVLCAQTVATPAQVVDILRGQCLYEKRNKPNLRQSLEAMLT